MVWAEAIDPQDRGQALAVFARQMRGEPVVSGILCIRTPRGEVKWVRDRAFPGAR